MSETIRRAAVAVAAAALLGGGAYAGGHGPAHTYHYVAQPEDGNFAQVDLGPASAHDGSGQQEQDISDVIAFTESLTRDGRAAGQIHVAGIGVDHLRGLTQVTATISLADGTVALEGVVTQEPRSTLAVVGGTGRYAGASGTLALDFTGPQEQLTLTLRGR